MPKLATAPADPAGKAVGLGGPKERPCFGADLTDLPAPVLPYS